ncbi:MAG: hypothetical protein KFH98_09760 [Gemmatimonadetes bacterium]|nr:hypothetical protein [Gemmatimonadota bacterium]
MTLHLKGPQAVLLVVGVVAFAGWRGVTAYTDLEDGAAQELSEWLRAEHARDQLRDISSVGDVTPAKLDSILAGQRVTFASVRARGAPEDMVVRVEVLIDGTPPRDGAVRYYRMSYGAVTGWRMKREVHAWTFYTKLL